jgi:hypothetical protein
MYWARDREQNFAGYRAAAATDMRRAFNFRGVLA